MPEIIKAYRQHLPALRLIGKRYGDGDRDPDGSYMGRWIEWFQNGWFGVLGALGPLPENEGGCMGCTCVAGGMNYWIGMFFPKGTPVPDGFQSADIPAGDAGICWIRGRREDGEIFRRNYELCAARLLQEGYRFEDDFAGSPWPWVFERYQTPRFTEADEDGRVILDYGIYLKPEPCEAHAAVPPEAEALACTLHSVAIGAGCAFHTDETAYGRTVSYSARNIKVNISDGTVTLSGEYDIRALIKLYRKTDDDTVKRLLFDAAIPCCYCIDDKCTTFLMAQQRTIECGGKTKKLCGPYRHHLSVPVDEGTLAACIVIMKMMLEYVYPHMHREMSGVPDEVSYKLTDTDTFYILGYKQRHSPLSLSDTAFAAAMLKRNEEGLRRVDTLVEAAGIAQPARFVGATDGFVNGASYDFIFGVAVEKRPETMPDGAVCRKVPGGRWAVYSSPSGDYKGIWRHFTERFYPLERMGYDDARIPFEYYDESGAFSDVHIPVDADKPDKSGMVLEVTHTPNELLAGFTNYAETDYPLYRDRPFDPLKRVTGAFPHAQCLVRVSIHSLFGKPLMGFDGVPVDGLSVIPDDFERYELKGGYWRRLKWKHFNGGYQGWGEAIEGAADSAVALNTMHHPRGFNEYVYDARGGYSEIGVPMRLMGKRSFEIIALAPQTVIGKLEAPPESVVTAGAIRRFQDLPENLAQGSYVIAFTYVQMKQPNQEYPMTYYDKPFIQGVIADAGAAAPDGFSVFTLEGGPYVKVSEDLPNGVLGWEFGDIMKEMQKETGLSHDGTRRFIYKQYDDGKWYELYVPVTRN